MIGIAGKRGFDTEMILLSGTEVEPCNDCGVCKKKKECPIDDDMQRIYPVLESADGIIVTSPVYFGSPTAQLKALFDRSILLRRNGFLLRNKIGGALAVGGSRNGGQEFTLQVIHLWMHIHGMIVIADGSHFGGTLHKPVESDTDGMKTAQDTVTKLCDTLLMLKKQ